MATNQKVVGSDLFVVNRIETGVVKTYKTTANDIGVFLLEAPHPDGTNPDDKFVNDGCLNVYGNTPGVTQGYINLHSANEYCEGKLSFNEDFFVVTGSSLDVRVELNFNNLAGELACDGLDGSSNCLKLDMVWLAENIICDGKGLDNSCGNGIGIDLCDHSGLQFKANGCLQVNLCDKGIIHAPGDGCLEADLVYLTNNLSCNGLRPSNGDTNSSCIEIDMGWLSNNIRCGDLHRPDNSNGDLLSGLVDGGGCIEIDPCWVGDQFNTNNGQVVLVTDQMTKSIDTDGCNIAVNEDWLLAWAQDNIKTISKNGGSECLETEGNGNLFEEDFKIKLNNACLRETIDDRIETLAVMDIKGGNCIDVTNGGGPDVTIALDPACDGSNAPVPGDGQITIKQGGTTKGTFTVNQGNNTTINLDATAGAPPAPPNDGELKIKKGENGIRFLKKNQNNNNYNHVDEIIHSADTDVDAVYKIDVDPESCPDWNVTMSGLKMFLKASGGGKQPTLVLGSQAAYDGKCIDNAVNPDGSCEFGRLAWLGVSSNQQNGSFTCHRGIEGWGDITNCGGSPSGETDILFSVAAGTKVLPHHGTAGVISSNTKLAEDVRIFRYNNFGGDSIVGGPPQQKAYNRLSFRKSAFLRGQITELSRATDARVNINIDDVIDAFGGYADDPDVTNGLFRWGSKPMDEYEGHEYPFLFIDADELGARLPGFVDYTPDSTAWEPVDSIDEETGEVVDTDLMLKEDFDPATQTEVGAINWQALHAVAIAALAKHKKRIEVLESREGMLNVLGIVEYNNETAAANSGLGQGEVYWDLELNRMRAVT